MKRTTRFRENKFFQQLAQYLSKHNISANTISIYGMLFAVAAAIIAPLTHLGPGFSRFIWILIALLIIFRLIAGLIDGMVAHLQRTATKTGLLFNEIPDRISDLAIFIGLGFAAGGSVVLGFLAAIAALLTAYIRDLVHIAGAPNIYHGIMGKPQRLFLTILMALYLGVTPFSWHPTLGNSFGLVAIILLFIFVGALFTCYQRLKSAINFLRQNN